METCTSGSEANIRKPTVEIRKGVGRLAYKGKNGKPELQTIISYNKPEDAQELYKERWQIETGVTFIKCFFYYLQ